MAHSSQTRIARAAGQVMLLFVLSRLLGLAREMIIGARFGTSAELDAYLAAFRLPDLIFQLVAGGALGSAFIPTFTAHLTRDDRAAAWRLASAVINLALLLLTLIALLAALFARPLVARVIAPGFSPAQQALTAQLLRGLLVSTVIFGVSGIVMGILNAFQHFLAPALAPTIYNLGIIGGAWFLAPRWGVHGLVAGVVAGAAGHLLVQLPALLRRRPHYVPTLGLSQADVREVGRLMGPRVLGLAAVQVNFLVNTILASGLAEGSLAALNYAWLLMLLPQGVVAQGIATAAFPTFSALVAREERAEMRATFSATLRAILFLSIPASAGLFVLRLPLIRLLLERGAFGSASTAAVAYALAFYSWGLVAHAVVEITARAFYALHDTLTPVLVGLAAMALNIVLSLALRGPLQHGGLALANTVATGLEMAVLLVLLRRRLGGLEERRVARATLRAVLVSGVMALALAGGLARWPVAHPLLLGGGGLLLGGAIYLLGMAALRAEELRMLPALLRRRQGGQREAIR
ncbi:MAG: murein biosynthesis integral membrane protein MurJ [Anaerolineae bacterium]|nr:murein biosynthesis integral membrane protein MurJ [Anaerolineae bacterium]